MFENRMTKNLLNGIKIVVDLPDAHLTETFPMNVGIESYGTITTKLKIDNFEKLKEIEDYYSKFNTIQYELVEKPLKDLGYV
jgi:hypothetical protein